MDIMVRATEVGSVDFYPEDIITIWHIGRSADGLGRIIEAQEVYYLVEEDVIRGYVHFNGTEIVGLFVDPNEHRKGYGKDLFNFAVRSIPERPVTLKATLNAVPFYSRMGCRKVRMDLIRRHDRDIYIQLMEYI